ncbi:hypothetical protein [Hydrogenophaga defluvii]|uniref:Uncharacterized protein n=1 Tax=Hydrogenophaga defluvii TaxID=249410 RepID=A0ABW2SHY0_9BURK
MKPTEFWSWSLKRENGLGRHVMSGKYTEVMAATYWPDRAPEKVPGSVEIRNLPETPEEVLMNMPGAWRNCPSAQPRNTQAARE